MSDTTKIGAMIDALVTTLTAALPNVTVVDGPAINGGMADQLYIGWDGTEGGSSAATATQDWAGLGNKARDEYPIVTCYAESYKGSATMKTTRDAALAVTAQVETSLRADPTIGGVLPQPGWAWYAETVDVAQFQTTTGTKVGVVFHIAARTRI